MKEHIGELIIGIFRGVFRISSWITQKNCILGFSWLFIVAFGSCMLMNYFGKVASGWRIYSGLGLGIGFAAVATVIIVITCLGFLYGSGKIKEEINPDSQKAWG